MPEWLKSVIYGRGSVRLSILLNDMQTLILLGMLLYLFLRWSEGSLFELMGAVIFLGGYLFHMFWESSASYTIPYFVLLIPYAVCGMAEWTMFLESAVERLRGTEERGAGEARKLPSLTEWRKKPGKVLAVAAVLVFLLLVLAFTRTNLFHRTLALNDDLQGIDASAQFYQTGVNAP